MICGKPSCKAPIWSQLLPHSSRHVVSKAMTDTMPASMMGHHLLWLCGGCFPLGTELAQQSVWLFPNPHQCLTSSPHTFSHQGQPGPKWSPSIVWTVRHWGSGHGSLFSFSSAAEQANEHFPSCLLPALLLFGIKFSSCGCYLLLYTFFLLLVIKCLWVVTVKWHRNRGLISSTDGL